MTLQDKTLYLVDGTAYVYRAYHAFNLSTASGEPTGAIFGVGSMMNRIIQEYDPEFLVIVFDAKGKTFRDDMYPEYKANRSPMPDDLRTQYDVIRELVDAMGIKTISITGVEADDVIGTLTVAAQREGMRIVIASADKDLTQLVSDRVVLRDEMRGEELGPDGVLNKFGVPPERIVDYLSLVGDTSDNIPGVPLVGKKTATKWLEQHGTLDSIIACADSFTGKAGENLRASLEQLELARKLVTLKLDVDLEMDLDSFRLSSRDVETLHDIYSKFEFRSWLKELEEDRQAEEAPEIHYSTILDAQALDDLVLRLGKCDRFALDTETTGLDTRKDSLVGISISMHAGEAFYIPVAHNYPGMPIQLDRQRTLHVLKPVLENPDIGKILQNLKFDAGVFAKYGVELKGTLYDTMIESYVLNSTAVSRHSLDNLALKYLNYATTKYEDVAGKGKSQLTFDSVDIETASCYAAEDADIALRLHEALWPLVQSTGRLQSVFDQIEMPLVPVLARIENYGVRLDRDSLHRQSAEIQSRIESVENDIYESAGMRFNLSSPKQIGHVLFDILGLPTVSKTSTGKASTSESVLSELAVKFDVPRLILEHRGLFKLKSTYTDKLPELIRPDTGRVHTSYHQAVAATGRLSSSDPNLQNIPIRTEEGRRVREAFVAAPGSVLMSIDYSQIELRIMAHLSQDESLLDAFAQGADVHRFTASEVFGVEKDAVTFDQRRHAKAINFGLIYGMSAFGLARQLQIDVAKAKEYVDQYFERYPKVKDYMSETREQARTQRYVETIYGRRLYLADINARHFGRRQHAERTAINAPLQGSAADVIKMAMIEVDDWISRTGSDARIIMQVHDELVLEVLESEQDKVLQNVKEMMENVAQLRVPLLVDSGVGPNWSHAHD